MKHRKASLGAVAGLGIGVAIGMIFGNPLASNAQTTTTPTTPTTVAAAPTADAGTTFSPNTDPNHEAAETPEHEAEEKSGKFRGHGGHSNTDPAHEAAESAEHAAEEAAQDAATVTTSTK